MREFRTGDELPWFAYLRLPEVMRLTGWHIMSPSELLPLLEPPHGEPTIRFALADADGCLAGTIGFQDWTNDTAEIAYDLAPPWWGKGIATAACMATCEWGFAQLKLAGIKACAMPDNRASARVLEKCGFSQVGVVRETRHSDGRAQNYRVYQRPAKQAAYDNI